MKVILWVNEHKVLKMRAVTKHGHDMGTLRWLENFNITISLRRFGGDSD